jgi:hypothetical protein
MEERREMEKGRNQRKGGKEEGKKEERKGGTEKGGTEKGRKEWRRGIEEGRGRGRGGRKKERKREKETVHVRFLNAHDPDTKPLELSSHKSPISRCNAYSKLNCSTTQSLFCLSFLVSMSSLTVPLTALRIMSRIGV